MLSVLGSQNRKYYIIGTHVYYILLVCHVNAISTSCSCIIATIACCHFVCVFTAYCGPTLGILYCYLFHY